MESGARISNPAHCPEDECMDMSFVSILQVGKPWHMVVERSQEGGEANFWLSATNSVSSLHLTSRSRPLDHLKNVLQHSAHVLLSLKGATVCTSLKRNILC